MPYKKISRDEVYVKVVDPVTRAEYEILTEYTVGVHYDVGRYVPATYYEPEEPGGLQDVEAEWLEGRVWISPHTIQAGEISVGLGDVISDLPGRPAGNASQDDDYAGLDDGDYFSDGGVEVNPRPEHIEAVCRDVEKAIYDDPDLWLD